MQSTGPGHSSEECAIEWENRAIEKQPGVMDFHAQPRPAGCEGVNDSLNFSKAYLISKIEVDKKSGNLCLHENLHMDASSSSVANTWSNLDVLQ